MDPRPSYGHFYFLRGPLVQLRSSLLFTWTLGPVTVLDIIFDYGIDSLFKLNDTPNLSHLKGLLNLWSTRDLTAIGGITIVKTLGLSQLVQVLPDPHPHLTPPPEEFLKGAREYYFPLYPVSRI